MFKKRRLFFLSSVFLCGITTQSFAETLDQAISRAVSNHPLAVAAGDRENSAYQSIQEEKSANYPTTSVTGSFGRVYSDNTTTRGLSITRGVGYSWMGEGRGSVSQTLYDWSKTLYAVDAATARYHAAGKSTEGQRINLALQASQAYLQLLKSNTLLDKSKSYQSKMNSYYKRIKTAFDDGGVDVSEVTRAQNLLSLVKNSVLQYEGEVKIAGASYREIIGDVPTDKMSDPSVDLTNLPETMDDAILLALDKNPQIASLGLNAKASHLDWQREKSNILPKFDAELSYSKKDQKDLVGGEGEDARALVKMNWNYSFGGAEKALRRRAKIVQHEALMNRDAIERTIKRDVEVAWVSMYMANQMKDNERDILAAANKTSKIYKEQYEGGKKSILDLMTADNAVFLAKQDFINITYQEMNAVYSLMGVIGIPFYKTAELHIDNNDK